MGPYSSLVQPDRIASLSGQSARVMPLMRKYQIAHLTPSHTIVENTVSAPAIPMFQNAFAAFGRGAIVRTEAGPMAIEDLIPGDRILTTDRGYQTLLWRGAICLRPDSEVGKMTRITTDAMGYARPSLDLVLGPAARILHKNPAIKVLTGADAALIPAQDFVDGSQIIALNPMSTVQCYQLGFAHHTCITVNGIDVETLHPGPAHTLKNMAGMAIDFASLFPHMPTPASFGSLAAPRLRKDDIDLVQAA